MVNVKFKGSRTSNLTRSEIERRIRIALNLKSSTRITVVVDPDGDEVMVSIQGD